MDRREFFGLGGGVAGATVCKAAGVGIKDDEAAEVAHAASLLRAALAAQGGPQDNGRLTVSVSGEFMEDYTAGTPWLGTFAKVEVPYLSRNGTAQVYSFAGKWMGVNPEIMARVYADPDPEKFPEKESMTGWTAEITPLPPVPPPFANQKLSILPPTAFIISDTDYRQKDPVILPGDERKPDRLFVYRDASLYIAPLADDGTVGEWVYLYTHPNPPLVKGPLPAGTQYIFEGPRGNNCFFEYGRFPYGCRPSIGLRDASNGASYNLDFHNIFTEQDQAFQRIYPLTCTIPGEYHCIAVELHGTVTYLHLKLEGDTFHLVAERPAILGKSHNGLVGVSEGPDGVAQVYLFDLPRVRTWELRNYGQDDAFVRQFGAGVDLPGYQFPNYPDGTTYELMCQYNPATTEPEVFLLVQEPLTREDGSHPDPLSELWSTSLRQTGWEKLTLIDKGLRNIVPMAGPSPAVFLQRPRTGYEYWTRNEGGDWDVMHLRLEGDKEEMIESAGYRVGITMKRNGETIGSGEVGVTASVATTAIIQGRHGILGIHRPWKASADATGTLWITVLLEERTSFPDLVLTSPLFSDRLVLDLNHRIQGFFSNVSEQQLLNARDPRRCREEEDDGCSAEEISGGLDSNPGPLITDREKAEKSAGMIRETLNVAPKPAQLSQSSRAQVTVESKIPWGWLPMSSDIRTLHPVMAANSGPSWRVYRQDGVAHLERVSSAEARTRMAELNAIHRPWEGAAYFGIFDFISDAFDAIADAARSVYDGACRLAEAVVDGLKITINLVYDGITWVYNAVMDTIDMVMDAIDFVLEFAGMALGMAVGWLLEQLGFLFDWKAIKQRRDRLHSFLKAGLRPALNQLGDPVSGAKAMLVHLETAKGQANSLFSSMLSTPADKRAFDQSPQESGPFENLSFIRGISVLPELTWLLDKLQSVFPKSRGGFSFPNLPGMDEVMGTLLTAVVEFVDAIGGVFHDATRVIEEWIVEGKLFTSEAFDPVIRLLMALVGRIFTVLSKTVEIGAKALQILLNNAEGLLNAFDNPMSVPAFFRGFYKGLSGNDCSALDAVCLLAAIPSYAEDTESPNNTASSGWLNPGRYVAGRRSEVAGAPQPHLEDASFHGTAGSPLTHLAMEGMPGMAFGGGGSNSAARQAAIVLGSIGALFSALNTGLMAASTPNDPMEQFADICSYCNMAATAGFQIANLNDEARWELLGTSGCVGLAALLVGLYYKYVKRNTQVMSDAIARGRNTLSDNMSWCMMYAAAINFYLTIAELATKSYDEAVSGTITFLELLFSIYIRERRKTRPFGPYVATGFGALMGAMNGGKIAIYALRPISG